ncbi:MAG: ribosomal protein [Candidatus Midichloriaceae bacterium]|jgi:large subunit ribosomal protein L18|nr:ribosomal protein [Candidatus Midichloriaceae bacterium]
MATINKKFERRRQRVRTALQKRAYGRLRLSVYRSDAHIYAQLIDDSKGCTVASASTLEKDVAKGLKSTSNIEAATKVGATIAERAIKFSKNKDLEVVFDRGGYIYHGRVKALAEAARLNGLKF